MAIRVNFDDDDIKNITGGLKATATIFAFGMIVSALIKRDGQGKGKTKGKGK